MDFKRTTISRRRKFDKHNGRIVVRNEFGSGSTAVKNLGHCKAICRKQSLDFMLIVEGSVERCNRQWVPRNKKETQQRDKLCRDRQIVSDVIRRTLLEVAEDGDWQTLQRAIGILERSSSSVLTLRANYENLKTSIEAICNDLLAKKQQYTLELHNCDEKVAYLQDKIKDCVLNTNTQLSYADKWLCARAESIELKFQFDTPTAAPSPEHEYRIHNELLRAYELQIKEREESLEYWRIRYADDTAKLNERLAQQCEKLRLTAARRTELQQLYDLHQGEIRGWLTFKKERAARRAREERLRVAATRIQAWWRGVMVRRALGPYRYLRNAKKAPAKTKKK